MSLLREQSLSTKDRTMEILWYWYTPKEKWLGK